MTHDKKESEADDLDRLFQLPLPEFTAARNALSAQLKKNGSVEVADRVKALSKPPISAWAVNQLYWKHPEAFQTLLAAGERFAKAQAAQLAGKSVDTRTPLAARRDALLELVRQAGALLRDAGHNPGPETIRRITATLEALSTGSSPGETVRPGRLTDDIDPPGFESLAALIPDAGLQRDDGTQSAMASAKAKLAAAEKALAESRTQAKESASRVEEARIAAEEARRRLDRASADADKAMKNVERAELAVEKAREEVEAFAKGSRPRKK